MLDTNVLVSAFVFPGGPPEAVYRRVLSGELTMIVSRALLAERGRVLVDKFDWEAVYAEEVLAQLVRIGDLVDPRESVEDIVDDPADSPRGTDLVYRAAATSAQAGKSNAPSSVRR